MLPGAAFDPVFDQALGKEPFAGHTGARNVTVLDQTVDLFFIDVEVGRNLASR